MKTLPKRIPDKQLLTCFFVSLITAFLTFIYFILKSHGAFTLVDDFNTQQLTFAAALQTALKEFQPGQWYWNLDLGSSLINGFSFYNLGSIFYWISFLFPKTWFPYLVGWLYILKYVVASLTAYLFLKRFVNNKNYAVVGALLYSFSGFQATNLEFYHFHDVVALFPLLLIGLEELNGRDKKKKLFIFAVFINCLLNYYFFVVEVIFLILYYFIRFWRKPLNEFFRSTLTCICCGLLGVGMASILFIPSILYVTGNTRSVSAFYLSRLVYDAQNFLFVIKGFLLPGEPMRSHSAIILMQWNSTSCYLPFVGFSLVFAYIAGKKNDWLKRLLIILLVISFSPLLQSGFFAFTEATQRWWFMLTLMMALASVIVLDQQKNFAINKYILLDVIITIIFGGCIKYIPWAKDAGLTLFIEGQFLTWLIIAISGPILLAIILNWKNIGDKNGYRGILALTMCFSIITTGLTLHYYREGTNTRSILNQYTLGTKLQILDDQYRYNTADNMLTLTGQGAGLGCFSSTIQNSSKEFDRLFDHNAVNFTVDKNVPGLIQLLGGKYCITTDPGNLRSLYKVAVDNTNYYVVEVPACPIGFKVNHFITQDSLLSLERDKRAIALLNAIVVDSDNIPKVDGIASKLDPNTLDYENGLNGYVDEAVANRVQNFNRNSSGFSCTSNESKNSLFFFSVPYDEGWEATIDGKKSDIVDTCGMMGLCVPSGKHSIQFTYQTPGFNAGIKVSLISWLIYLTLLYFPTLKLLMLKLINALSSK